jgi:hypothetical protein
VADIAVFAGVVLIEVMVIAKGCAVGIVKFSCAAFPGEVRLTVSGTPAVSEPVDAFDKMIVPLTVWLFAGATRI